MPPASKPLIGITPEFHSGAHPALGTGAHFLYASYTTALIRAGALPVILPVASDEIAESVLARLDGLLLTGDNRDMPPSLLGEARHPASRPAPPERWESDRAWLAGARDREMPVLAVCFGMQLLNAAEGGSLYQDIPTQRPESDLHFTEDHRLDHPVQLEPGALLASMAPASTVRVRSTHHQAVREPAPGFIVAARSPDGLIEAIEHPGEAFLIGVQWHPELANAQPDWLLQGFVEHCRPGAPDDDH